MWTRIERSALALMIDARDRFSSMVKCVGQAQEGKCEPGRLPTSGLLIWSQGQAGNSVL